MASPSRRTWLLVAGGFLLPTVLVAGVVFVAAVWIQPPAGEIVAESEIESGTPFELRFESDGMGARVFLDVECDDCSLPVTGELSASSEGVTLASVEIDAGEDTAATNHEELEERPLLTIPEHPPSAAVIVRGTLTVHGERGWLVNEPLEDAPPPIVRRFRLTVAR